MFGQDLSNYRILISGVTAWFIAQFLKVPFEYLLNRRWLLTLWLSPGGMPSSHSALVTGTMVAIGLFHGFDTPEFALSVALSMVVIYDAAGVRRQAGLHAQALNLVISELLSGHPVSDERLREVLGHTPREVLGGVTLGVMVPLLVWLFWK
jgi:acid phosphatase family membrane protein YuiD